MSSTFAAVHESGCGTKLARAYATTCPQLAKADVAPTETCLEARHTRERAGASPPQAGTHRFHRSPDCDGRIAQGGSP
jgi:hypothetical protein